MTTTIMAQAQKQQFTFIDATAGKEVNKRRVKSHVAFDTNRRKRRHAVAVHQQTVPPSPDAASQSRKRSPESSASPPETAISSPPAISNEVNSSTPSTVSVNTPDSIHHAQLTLQPFSRSPSLAPKAESRTDHDREEDETDEVHGLGLSNVIVPDAILRSQMRRQRKALPTSSCPEIAHFDIPGASSATRISPYINLPQDLFKVEMALRQTKFFLHGRYENAWALKMRDVPYVYDVDYEVSSWRESCFIANSLISSGKTKEGFLALNEALEVAPKLLRQQHPHLLMALLELNLQARNWKDSTIQKEVNGHMAQMAGLILGQKHPITMLMRNDFAGDEKKHAITEALFSQNVDTMRNLFGAGTYSPLSAQIALAQYVASRGSFPKAYSHMDAVSQKWGALFSPNSAAMKLVAFERAKVRALETRDPRTELQYLLGDLVTTYEEEMASNATMNEKVKALISQSSRRPSINSDRKRLATWLMSRSCHALAMHTYTHLPEIFDGTGPDSPDWSIVRTKYSLSTNVVKIALAALTQG